MKLRAEESRTISVFSSTLISFLLCLKAATSSLGLKEPEKNISLPFFQWWCMVLDKNVPISVAYASRVMRESCLLLSKPCEQHQKLIQGADEQSPLFVHLVFHWYSTAATEIFIPMVVNNECTKKRGSSFLVYSVDSNQRLCCITTWLRSYLMVTIRQQGAMETAHNFRTVNPQSTELCTWRQKSCQRSCLVFMLAVSKFLSGRNSASATTFFLYYSTSPKEPYSTDATAKEHCI